MIGGGKPLINLQDITTEPASNRSVYILTDTDYNLGHNILEFYNILVQIRLTASRMKRDIHIMKRVYLHIMRVKYNTQIDTFFFKLS